MSRHLTTAGAQIAELAAGAEDGRFSRGRALFRKGSVLDLLVTEGSIVASVRGSEGDPYEVSIGTMPAPAGVRRQVLEALAIPAESADSGLGTSSVVTLDAVIGEGIAVSPRESDLAFSCGCLDWDEFCKHVVAVLLALADRIDLDDTALLTWRSIEMTPAPPAGEPGPSATPHQEPEPSPGRVTVTGTGTGTPGAPADDRTSGSPDDPADDPADDRKARLTELEALLGDTAVRVGREPAPAEDQDQDQDQARPNPALAEFLGLDRDPVAVDYSAINVTVPAPLFVDFQLGPLADLGPALADGLAIVTKRLADQT